MFCTDVHVRSYSCDRVYWKSRNQIWPEQRNKYHQRKFEDYIWRPNWFKKNQRSTRTPLSVFTYGPSLLFFDSLKVCDIVSKWRICTSELHELVSIDQYRCAVLFLWLVVCLVVFQELRWFQWRLKTPKIKAVFGILFLFSNQVVVKLELPIFLKFETY